MIGVAPWPPFFELFERSIFDLNSDTPFFEIFGDFGTKKEAKMVKNLLKIEQHSPKIAKMSENAKVHLDLCFTYPNGSPHDQESTKIGRQGSKIHENMLKKACEKSNEKNLFFIDFWTILGSLNDPQNHENGPPRPPQKTPRPQMTPNDNKRTPNYLTMIPNGPKSGKNHHFCLPFRHFWGKVRFSCGRCASANVP